MTVKNDYQIVKPFNFIRKFKAFRAQRGAKKVDFAFQKQFRKSKPFRAQRGAKMQILPSISSGILIFPRATRSELADA